MASAADAVPAAAAKKVAEGNAAYAAGDYGKALEAYGAAAPDCPECPELSYNRGLVEYRQRDFAKARSSFNAALSTRDLRLEARAKFNLGNVGYAEALEKVSDLKEAIIHAEEAIDRYRDALAVLDKLDKSDPTIHADADDARANIETAALLIKDLLDKQKKQQDEQKKDQKQDQQDKQDQGSQQDQQDQQEQGQEGEKKDDQDKKEGDDKKDGQKSGQEKKDDRAEQDKQQQQQAGQQDQQQQQQDQQDQGSAAGQAKDAPQRPLSQEEVQRMLQAVRDKEAQRRDDRNRKMRVRNVPVERDW